MTTQGWRKANWLADDSEERDVVVSSRVRVARNLADFRFLSRAPRDEKEELLETIRQAAHDAPLADSLTWIDIRRTPPLERSILVERHIVSKQLVRGDEPRGVVFSTPDERLSLMINEEDHIRLQAMGGGLALGAIYADIDAADDRLETQLEFAFSPRFGYLTACPTNVGTGARFSVMLHLPGLKLAGELDKVRKAARAMNLAVRGFYGEGSEAVGDFYQLSNQTTLGKSERDILQQFEGEILPRIVDYERRSRQALLVRRRAHLEDRIHRALATLASARLMSADEAMALLSSVRLGVMLNMLEKPRLGRIHELMLLAQPAHLQQAVGREINQRERRSARADLIRARILAD